MDLAHTPTADHKAACGALPGSPPPIMKPEDPTCPVCKAVQEQWLEEFAAKGTIGGRRFSATDDMAEWTPDERKAFALTYPAVSRDAIKGVKRPFPASRPL